MALWQQVHVLVPYILPYTGMLLAAADALVELIVQAGAVDTVVPLLSIGEKAEPAQAARYACC